MGSYVTAMGGHDAEWLLQREREISDRHLAAARRGRQPVSKHALSSSRLGEIRPVADWEAALVSRFVHRNLPDPEAASEVLQMLGLEES